MFRPVGARDPAAVAFRSAGERMVRGRAPGCGRRCRSFRGGPKRLSAHKGCSGRAAMESVDVLYIRSPSQVRARPHPFECVEQFCPCVILALVSPTGRTSLGKVAAVPVREMGRGFAFPTVLTTTNGPEGTRKMQWGRGRVSDACRTRVLFHGPPHEGLAGMHGRAIRLSLGAGLPCCASATGGRARDILLPTLRLSPRIAALLLMLGEFAA